MTAVLAAEVSLGGGILALEIFPVYLSKVLEFIEARMSLLYSCCMCTGSSVSSSHG